MLGTNNSVKTTHNVAHWLGDIHDSQISVGCGKSPTHERKLTSNEHLFLAGNAQSHIYQVVEGVVGSYKLLGDGRRQIVTFFYPGDLIGIEEAGTWEYYGEALCPSKVRCISVNTVDRLIRNDPKFGQAMVAALASELAEQRDQLLSLGRKSAVEKVATFLLRVSRRHARENGDGCKLYLPMTRAEIADYLGLTIETVSRNITRLRKEKVIELNGANSINILDLELLKNIAAGEA